MPLGRHRGVASIKGIKVHGIVAWAMWRAIYLLKTPGWRRRFRVAMDWFINLFCSRDYAQLGMMPASHREFHGQHLLAALVVLDKRLDRLERLPAECGHVVVDRDERTIRTPHGPSRL